MQKREIWKVIVFGLITLGIYDLVWLYKTRNEMAAKGQKVPSFWLLLAPFLMFILMFLLNFIIHFVSAQNGADDVQNPGLGLVNILTILIVTLAVFGSIPLIVYWFYAYCKAVEGVTGGQTNFGFSFGLWFVLNLFNLGFVWPGLIQDGFNKFSGTPDTAPTGASSYSA